MKLIVSVWNTHNRGKSQTLRKVAEMLFKQPGARILSERNFIVPRGKDFSLILKIDGIKYGIESKGDPGTRADERIQALVDQKCKIILCSTRMKGSTSHAVEDLALKNKYKLIWTSTYETANERDHEWLNKLKARHILLLVRKSTRI